MALRTAARVLGIVVCLLWLVPLVGGLFSSHDESNGEGLVLAVLVISAMAATLLSFRVGPAAWAVVVCGLALGVFGAVTAGRNQWVAVLVAGLPWLVVGALFLAADRVDDEAG